LPLSLMREIGRVIFFYACVECRPSVILYDFLHLSKVLGCVVARDGGAMNQFDLICDLISLKNVKTGVMALG